MRWVVDQVEKRREDMEGDEMWWEKRENNKEINNGNVEMMVNTS
jgi:hypothetical protein